MASPRHRDPGAGSFYREFHQPPVALGCIYDLKHRSPGHSAEKAVDSIVYQSKNHRLEIISEEGKESIIISTAKENARYV